jgi:predicted transposase YbfD/YdcC
MNLLKKHFGDLTDSRLSRKQLHKLYDIVVICICGAICGEDGFVGIALWAEDNEEWLREHLSLANGIPSHDTLNRVFQLIDYKEFGERFAAFTAALRMPVAQEIIALDGKCLRGTHNKSTHQTGLCMVGAWATQNQLLLAQERVSGKSNEITAIPELLRKITINNCVVTIDAMGCQQEIAAQIIAKEADYVLALKGNQPQLLEQVSRTFNSAGAEQCHTTTEKDHGRIEVRTAEVTGNLQWIEAQQKWANLRGLLKITSQRTVVATNTTSTEVRYFIMSQCFSAQQALHIVRSHWSIENTLHWSLDVTFGEDLNRIRTKNAAENFSFINRLAINLLKREPSKRSIQHKRNLANRSHSYLLSVLNPTTF